MRFMPFSLLLVALSGSALGQPVRPPVIDNLPPTAVRLPGGTFVPKPGHQPATGYDSVKEMERLGLIPQGPAAEDLKPVEVPAMSGSLIDLFDGSKANWQASRDETQKLLYKTKEATDATIRATQGTVAQAKMVQGTLEAHDRRLQELRTEWSMLFAQKDRNPDPQAQAIIRARMDHVREEQNAISRASTELLKHNGELMEHAATEEVIGGSPSMVRGYTNAEVDKIHAQGNKRHIHDMELEGMRMVNEREIENIMSGLDLNFPDLDNSPVRDLLTKVSEDSIAKVANQTGRAKEAMFLPQYRKEVKDTLRAEWQKIRDYRNSPAFRAEYHKYLQSLAQGSGVGQQNNSSYQHDASQSPRVVGHTTKDNAPSVIAEHARTGQWQGQ